MREVILQTELETCGQVMYPESEKQPQIKIEVRDLDFYYSDVQALHKVTIDIEEKKVSAFIGPSGCGKSTFLRVLNRMNDTIPGTRLRGTVKLDGTDIYNGFRDVSALRTRVGMVFQKSNPFPKSIFENVAYGLRVNGIRNKQTIAEAVEDTLRRAYLWDEVKDKLGYSAYTYPGDSSSAFVSLVLLQSDLKSF